MSANSIVYSLHPPMGPHQGGAAWVSGAEDAALRGCFGYVLGYEPGACGRFRGRQDRVARRRRAGAGVAAAAAAGAFVGDLQAAVADGQVTRQAGQDLFNHLQQLLFGPPGQNTQQVQQQYQQLIQAYDQHQSQGQITGQAVSRLRHDLEALGTALVAL